MNLDAARRSRRRGVGADDAPAASEADEDVLQAPRTARDEILLRSEPQSGRKGPEAAVAEDWTQQTCPSSKSSSSPPPPPSLLVFRRLIGPTARQSGFLRNLIYVD